MSALPTMTRSLFILPLLLSLHAGASAEEAATRPTPAETRIALAQKVIAARPDEIRGYSPLAFALAARARETSDPKYYTLANEVVLKGLKLEPNNFDVLKAELWLLLGQYEFQKALEKARILNKRSGDDTMVSAMLADAAIETGNYDEAEKATQWALDMDPGASTGLTRAAYLRELFGDFEGALELMQQAFNRTIDRETEDRAWLLTHIGHLHLLRNQLDDAAKAHEEALRIFPNYHYALRNLAAVRTAQGNPGAALELRRKHYTASPHSENLYELARALRRAGENPEADKAFSDFEKAAMGESGNAHNSNRELVYYFADEAKKPAEALRIAESEMARRKDFRTRQAYAWALHANGQFKKAHDEMKKALGIGAKYPDLQYQAGVISRDSGDKEAARAFLTASLAQAPNSDVSAAAKIALDSLESSSPPKDLAEKELLIKAN